MIYQLRTPLSDVKGVGEKIAQVFLERKIETVRDLLLILPLQYVDRSAFGKIGELSLEKELTFIGEVTSLSNFYRRPRSIQSATVKDETGRVKLMWFNNSFILKRLRKGESYVFSGKLNPKGSVIQPVVAGLGEESLHTGRIVPIYSASFGIKAGTLRRIFKEILDNLEIESGIDLAKILVNSTLESLASSLRYLHFPDNETQVVAGKSRLALEELLLLIKKSNLIRDQWQKLGKDNHPSTVQIEDTDFVPRSVPFELTSAQQRCVADLIDDLAKPKPMNRLLIGDVGSGKTVVAGIAAYHLAKSGQIAALVAPTKILAQQHFETLKSLFPDLQVELLTQDTPIFLKGGLVVGTHKVINRLETLQPSLIIYDEQHRFGVSHRSSGLTLKIQPHTLTMTATPIPRTLMLTIFSHLDLSVIDELPPGRKPVETYLSNSKKETDFFSWLDKILAEDLSRQIILVCPFIDQSETEGFEQIANVESKYKVLLEHFKNKYEVAKLHSGLKPKVQEKVIEDLFAQKTKILVTTPIVEVGVDLPTATVVAIYNAERFGLASLHQIRGRVGRRGEQGYCVLFSDSQSVGSKARLKAFTKENSGMRLAEFDLSNRGAGDIFGLAQSGQDGLRFADWTNLELISTARQIYNELESKTWQPLLEEKSPVMVKLPLAN